MRERLFVMAALLGVALGPLLVFFLLQGPRLAQQLDTAAIEQAAVAAEADAATLRSRIDGLRVTAMLLAELAAPGRPEGRGQRLEAAAARWLDGLPEVVGLQVVDASGRASLSLGPTAVAGGTAYVPTAAAHTAVAAAGAAPGAAPGAARVLPMGNGQRLAIMAPLPDSSATGALALIVDTALLAREILQAFWVTADGSFLHLPVNAEGGAKELPQLADLPDSAGPGIWRGGERAIAWAALPLDAGSTSFVGRQAALQTVHAWAESYRSTFLATLTLALLPATALAWYLAGRGASLRGRVAGGLKRLLDGEEVRFRWPGRGELALLAQDLNGIAQRYREAQAGQRKTQGNLAAERDLQAAAARAAGERARDLLDRLHGLSIGVLVVDGKGAVEDCNPAAMRLLGFPDRAALLGEDFHERLMHSRADGSPLPAGKSPLAQAAAGVAAEQALEAVLWDANAAPVPVAIQASALAGAEPPRMLVSFRDLREEKRRQARLAGERQQLEQALAALPDAVLALDVEGTVTRANSETEALTGWSVAEALGQPVDQVVQLDGMTVLEALATGKGGSANLEALLERRGGGHSYVRCVATPLVGTDGSRQGAVVVLRDLTGSPPRAHEAAYQASHDLLTGLVNRQQLQQRLQRLLERGGAAAESHALCYLDLDGYGALNQRLGTVAGDVLLQQIGSLLRSGVRARDTVARVGADEFALLLEHCTPDQALRVASALREAIHDFHFRWGVDSQALAASVGLLQLPAAIRSAEAALAAAESACMRAKESGGNRLELSRPDDARSHPQGAAHWIQKLNQALEQNRFRLFCQSIVPLRGKSVAEGGHYELLLRMVDDAGNLSPAGAFLPMAARYNMINTTDRWVTRTALEWLATRAERAEPLLLAINLGQATVADDGFPEHVRALLEETTVPAGWVCFQFSAAALSARPGDAVRLSRALKKLGCLVAVDNFGAECAAFSQLRDLKVDFIKIDPALVKEITVSALDRAMLRAVVEVARATGRHTVAKAVENDALLDAVRDLGVDFAQGYGVSRPRPLTFLKSAE